MAKYKNNSKKIKGHYKMIPEHTLLSKEFQSLTPNELKIYICFLTYWVRNGKNDKIKLSTRFISEHTGVHRNTVCTTLISLREKEFIDYISIKNIVTEYTLTSKFIY